MPSSHYGTGRSEPQPHIYGAQIGQFRSGLAVANADTPPSWSPELALNPDYPYTVEEYAGDLSRWVAATKVAVPRQGPLAALQLGGAARTIADGIHTDILTNGMIADFNDGYGNIQQTGIRCLIAALHSQFPTDAESVMFRTGMEFFQFTPRRGETLQALMLRFDTLLLRANRTMELGISYPFRTWMLMSLLKLSATQWRETLKECGRQFPRDETSYQNLKNILTRDRELQAVVGYMG